MGTTIKELGLTIGEELWEEVLEVAFITMVFKSKIIPWWRTNLAYLLAALKFCVLSMPGDVGML